MKIIVAFTLHIAGLFCLFVVSCTPSAYSIQKTYLSNVKDAPYDVIIVPGYPYTGAAWDRVVKMRTIWANYLFKKGYTKNIIFSGSSVYSPFTESKVMKLYAIEMGIPKENIYTEQTAEHSTENIYYSYRIAKQQGFKKIALATDPYQTGKLLHFIKKYELPLDLLPIVIDTLRTIEIEEPCIDPSSAYNANFVSIVERQTLYTRLRGTFGKHIVWHEEDLKKKKYKRRLKKRMTP